ncbi:MAG: cyclic nucleotide-binding domain-containing protein [Fuerstiella sp.]
METMDRELSELLRETRFAEGFSEQELQSVARAGRLHRAGKGTMLFQEGEVEDEVFVVCSGHVALEMQVPRRGNVRLLTVGSGELVGWSGLTADGRMTASAVVTEDATLIALSSKALRELCRSDHELGYLLMTRTARAISQRLLATRLQLLDLFAETQPQARPGQAS